MIIKLNQRPPTIQDESSLDALANCLRDASCAFPAAELERAFQAATSRPTITARLAGIYAKFCWYSLNDRPRAIRFERQAIAGAPREGVYRITLVGMLLQEGMRKEATAEIPALEALNIGGRFTNEIADLRRRAVD